MTTDQPTLEPQVADAQQIETRPPKPQLPDSRQRLRQLLAIPERDRTDANWDELVELEIQTAPGNRAQPQQANVGQQQVQSRRPEQVKRQDSNNRNRPGKRFIDKRRRGPGKPV